jgi:serine/threonine protein kinase
VKAVSAELNGTEVAVKQLNAAALMEDNCIEVFVRETRLMHQLDGDHSALSNTHFIFLHNQPLLTLPLHSLAFLFISFSLYAVVRLLGAVCEKNELSLVMTYCCNGSLFALLHNKSAQLLWQRRIRYALDIALGVRYLHSREIIHRDLKSPNVLFDGNWVAKLCDFGFAKTLQG